jgi:NCAIR mutase (PurE)-related protein
VSEEREDHLSENQIATSSIRGATVDRGRQARCGFGEVVYGEGKAPSLIASIATALLESQAEVLVTRLSSEQAVDLQGRFPSELVRYEPAGRTMRIGNLPPNVPSPTSIPSADGNIVQHFPVAVVTAGSTDRAIGIEARETLYWMGLAVDWIEDIGVAGPQRLQRVVPRLRQCHAIVVAAGMEGALPSVVAGYVPCPVIAVPTSVGYGASFGGVTAMLAMLTSCAAGVAVVNIDAGFKAGYMAGMIATAAIHTPTESP